MTGFNIQASIQTLVLTTALTATLAIASGAAQAQAPTKAQQDAIRSNCRSDYMKNCSSVTPGRREALECLMKNKANVSGGCQGALRLYRLAPLQSKRALRGREETPRL